MSDYANPADVTVRLPYREFGETTKPSLEEIEAWLDDGQAQLDAALGAAGLVTPLSDAKAIRIAKTWIVGYVEGLVRAAFAAAGGDDANRDGQDLIRAFMDLVGPNGQIVREPDRFSVYLTGGVVAETGISRSYATSHSTDKTIAPMFTKDEQF